MARHSVCTASTSSYRARCGGVKRPLTGHVRVTSLHSFRINKVDSTFKQLKLFRKEIKPYRRKRKKNEKILKKKE
jgi:hypothetical protein